MLNGFELHVYNRSELYSKLEQVFGIPPNIIPNFGNKPTENSTHSESQPDSSARKQRPEAAMARTWRDLIPVIKIDVSSVSNLECISFFFGLVLVVMLKLFCLHRNSYDFIGWRIFI